jgi:CspA family cold shock protein
MSSGDSAAARGRAFVMAVQQKHTGKVKWFNDQKGFGFIQQDGGGEDVFVHHTAILAEGYRTLAENDPVEFELQRGDKGLKAVNVVKKA